MLTHTYIYWNMITIYWITIAILLFIVLILAIVIVHDYNRMKEYRSVIVRIMSEKEEILKELPPEKRYKHTFKRKVTKEEVMSLLMGIKELFIYL